MVERARNITSATNAFAVAATGCRSSGNIDDRGRKILGTRKGCNAAWLGSVTYVRPVERRTPARKAETGTATLDGIMEESEGFPT